MPSLYSETAVFGAAHIPLEFLIFPESRSQWGGEMKRLSESARFFYLHDDFWLFRNSDALSLLNRRERRAVEEFNRTFNSLPWRVVDEFPHISELPADDLSPLIQPAERVLQLVEMHEQFVWLHWLFRKIRGKIRAALAT